MEHLKKILKYAVLITTCIIYSTTLLHAKKYLLNSYYNPNRIVFRLSSGVFECSLLGVVVPYYNNTIQCGTQQSLIYMSNLSIGFFQNHLNLEQLYDVSVINGYCSVNYGNSNFNERIIKDGYGIVNAKGIDNQMFLDKLLNLENIAMENKLGFWKDFYNEMQCFKRLYQ